MPDCLPWFFRWRPEQNHGRFVPPERAQTSCLAKSAGLACPPPQVAAAGKGHSNRFGSNQNCKSQPSPPPTASTLILILPATTGVPDTSQKKSRKLDKSSARLGGLLAGKR